MRFIPSWCGEEKRRVRTTSQLVVIVEWLGGKNCEVSYFSKAMVHILNFFVNTEVSQPCLIKTS